MYVIAAWHALVTVSGVQKVLVPSPVDVAEALIADWGLLWHSLLITLRITLAAFLCATVFGTLIAFAFGAFLEGAAGGGKPRRTGMQTLPDRGFAR